MSQIQSDNQQTTHPKPEWEHYRLLDAGVYRDYVNTAEVLSTNTELTYRKHKTFRIAGKDYICEADGTTFTSKDSAGAGGGVAPPEYYDMTGGETELAIADTQASAWLLVFKGERPLKMVATGATLANGEFKKHATDEKILFLPAAGATELFTVIKPA
jgi:hypothetical protein